MDKQGKLTIILITVLFAEIIVFVEIPILSAFLPTIEVLGFYLLLISLIPSLLIFAYKIMRSEKRLDVVLRVVMITLILFWLFAQTVTTITVELEYHGTVNEYSQLIEENVDKFNSSWAIAIEYRNVFDGTYGKNETLPNRVLLKNSILVEFTPLFWSYLKWFDGYEKLVVVQKKGNCGEFAIAIKTLLRDVTELNTRKVSMEGFDHAFPEVYWNGSWWVFDAIFTTPEYPVEAGNYAEYLKENERNVYECLRNLKDDETGSSVLSEHGFDAVNVTIVAIIDPTSNKSDDKPAENANIKIFALKNWYDPLVAKGKTDDDGLHQTVLRSYGDYIIVAESSDGRFVGIVEIDGYGLINSRDVLVRLHKYE